MNILITKVIDITKSALDIGTRYSSEDEADTEIEYNIDDEKEEPENVPEYDVEEDD